MTTPTEAMSLARDALELASTIADRVPTRWHERDPSEAPAEHDIGCMVNAQPDGQHGYRLIQDALSAVRAALAQQASVPSAEPAGLVRCEFDDECDYCSSPQGGTFTRLMRNAEDVTEAEFYICNDCVFRALDGLKYGAPLMAAAPTVSVPSPGAAAWVSPDSLAWLEAAKRGREAFIVTRLCRSRTDEASAPMFRAPLMANGLTPQETAATASVAGLVQPNNDAVICPQCAHQFRAIPINVQRLLLESGHEPPFTAPPAASAPTVQPLTDEQIVMDALMMMPTHIASDCAKACEYGIRYAEKHHGITAAPTKETP